MKRNLAAASLLLGFAMPSLAAEPIAPAHFQRLIELTKPHKGEDTFREIPWRTSLWQARKDAAKEGKPILAFLMSGPPLGCT